MINNCLIINDNDNDNNNNNNNTKKKKEKKEKKKSVFYINSLSYFSIISI